MMLAILENPTVSQMDGSGARTRKGLPLVQGFCEVLVGSRGGTAANGFGCLEVVPRFWHTVLLHRPFLKRTTLGSGTRRNRL